MMKNENNTAKPKNHLFIGGCIATLLLLCLFAGLFFRNRMQDRAVSGEISESGVPETETAGAVFLEETITFGEEWAHWTDYLVSTSKDEAFAYAFAQIGDDAADFSWGFYDDREAFAADFLQKKAEKAENVENAEKAMAQADTADSEKGALSWYFVKLRMDEDVHGTDIYEYLQQNLSEDGYIYRMVTRDEGNLYAISHVSEKAYEEHDIRIKRNALVYNGYLYFLVCEDMTPQNEEEVYEEMMVFEDHFYTDMYHSGTGMDEEDLYMTDHEMKVTALENPYRVFYQERATDLNRAEYDKIKAYFWLLREAEYQISLSPDMPEMIISFELQSNMPEGKYETDSWLRRRIEDTYKMEIYSAADGSLMQRTDIELTIDRIDLISFEDVDEDGCLEMKISYPTYWGSGDYWGDDYIEDIDHEDYWTWDAEIEKLVLIDKEELLARRFTEDTKDDGAKLTEDNKEYSNKEHSILYVEKGDSLWKLAEEYYGDGQRWGEIYENNRITIGDNPSLILPGMEFELPE